jgi:hypothetical protein
MESSSLKDVTAVTLQRKAVVVDLNAGAFPGEYSGVIICIEEANHGKEMGISF